MSMRFGLIRNIKHNTEIILLLFMRKIEFHNHIMLEKLNIKE